MDTLCRKAYYKENVTHPEVVGTKLIIYGKKLKCVLPCDSSKECDCLTGWDVTPLSDVSELEVCNSINDAFYVNFCLFCAGEYRPLQD